MQYIAEAKQEIPELFNLPQLLDQLRKNFNASTYDNKNNEWIFKQSTTVTSHNFLDMAIYNRHKEELELFLIKAAQTKVRNSVTQQYIIASIDYIVKFNKHTPIGLIETLIGHEISDKKPIVHRLLAHLSPAMINKQLIELLIEKNDWVGLSIVVAKTKNFNWETTQTLRQQGHYYSKYLDEYDDEPTNVYEVKDFKFCPLVNAALNNNKNVVNLLSKIPGAFPHALDSLKQMLRYMEAGESHHYVYEHDSKKLKSAINMLLVHIVATDDNSRAMTANDHKIVLNYYQDLAGKQQNLDGLINVYKQSMESSVGFLVRPTISFSRFFSNNRGYSPNKLAMVVSTQTNAIKLIRDEFNRNQDNVEELEVLRQKCGEIEETIFFSKHLKDNQNSGMQEKYLDFQALKEKIFQKIQSHQEPGLSV